MVRRVERKEGRKEGRRVVRKEGSKLSQDIPDEVGLTAALLW